MSNIKALDELREAVRCGQGHGFSSAKAYYEVLGGCIAEIEHEVSERYIVRPVGKDGIPIHVGDWLRYVDEKVQCAAITEERVYFWREKDEMVWNKAELFSQYKPRTLEDVLKELANEVWEASCTCQTTWSDSGLDGIEERYADEIRELMGVSE